MKTIKKRKKLGWFISFGLLLIVGWSAFIIMTPKKQEEPHGQAQSVNIQIKSQVILPPTVRKKQSSLLKVLSKIQEKPAR